MTPSVGRIVHFYPDVAGTPNEPLPAIITRVRWNEQSLGLLRVRIKLMYDGSVRGALQYCEGAILEPPYSDEPKAGHWTWPPRVP